MKEFIYLLCQIAADNQEAVKAVQIILQQMRDAESVMVRFINDHKLSLAFSSDINQEGEFHKNPLMVAAGQGNLAIVTSLVEDFNANVFAEFGKRTAMSEAAALGRYEVIEFLLDKYKLASMLSHEHIKAAHHATLHNNHFNAAELFLQRVKDQAIFEELLFNTVSHVISTNDIDLFNLFWVKVNVKRLPDLYRQSFLQAVIKDKVNIEILTTVITHCTFKESGQVELNSLKTAVKKRNLYAVYLLTERCIFLTRDISPLLIEAYRRHEEDLKIFFLLIKNGAHPKFVFNTICKDVISRNERLDEAFFFYSLLANKQFYDELPSDETIVAAFAKITDLPIIDPLPIRDLSLSLHEDLYEIVIATGTSDFERSEIAKLVLNPWGLFPASNKNFAQLQKLRNQNELNDASSQKLELTTSHLTLDGFYRSFYSENSSKVKPSSTHYEKLKYKEYPQSCFNQLLFAALNNPDQNCFKTVYLALQGDLKEFTQKHAIQFGAIAHKYGYEGRNPWDFSKMVFDAAERFFDRAYTLKNWLAIDFILAQEKDPDRLQLSKDVAYLLAVKEGLTDLIEILVKYKVNTNAKNGMQQSALTIAVTNNQPHLIEWCVEVAKVSIHDADYKGRTALDHALLQEDSLMIESLLSHGAKLQASSIPNLICDDNKSAFKYLVKHGLLNPVSFHNGLQSLLFLVMTNGANKIAGYVFNKYSAQINFKSVDDDGNTLLHLCLSSRHKFVDITNFIILLNHHISFAKINIVDETVFDKMVGLTYNFLQRTIDSHVDIPFSEREYIYYGDPDLRNFDKNNQHLSSTELEIAYAGYRLNRHPELSDRLKRIALICLYEEEQNKITYNKRTAQYLVPLRYYLVATVLKLLEDKTDKSIDFPRVSSKMSDDFALGKITNYHEWFNFFNSKTFNALERGVAKFNAAESSEDIPLNTLHQ